MISVCLVASRTWSTSMPAPRRTLSVCLSGLRIAPSHLNGGSEQRDQRGFSALVVPLAGEQGMRARKAQQRELTRTLFVLAAEMQRSLPRSRFDDGQRNFTASDHRLEGAASAAVFEPAARALLGRGLAALDHSLIGLVARDPGTRCEYVHAFPRSAAGDRNIDRINETCHRAVVDFDNGEPAVHS